MTNKQVTCPQCGSSDVRRYTACGYRKAKCNECTRNFSVGFIRDVELVVEQVDTEYGPLHQHSLQRTHIPGGRGRLEHEGKSFRSAGKNYTPKEE